MLASVPIRPLSTRLDIPLNIVVGRCVSSFALYSTPQCGWTLVYSSSGVGSGGGHVTTSRNSQTLN